MADGDRLRPYSVGVTTPSTASRYRGLTGAFRAVAWLEAVTYLVLLVGVVIYRVLDGPDFIGVMGPIHGVLFLAYLLLVLRIRQDQGWGLWQTAVIVVASALPLGGFWAGRHARDEPVLS